jgi:integrase
MGIKERKLADGKIVFEADVRIANIDRKTGTFNTRKDAEKFLATTTAAARKALRARASKLTEQASIVGERNFERAKLANVIVAFRESSAASERAKRSLVDVADLVGNVSVANADEDWSEAYIAQMRAGLNPRGKPYAWATIVEHFSYMKIACKWWARRNKVANPFIGLSTNCIPRNWDNKRERRLEAGEHEKILAQIIALPTRQAHWRCLLTLALETGARLQELVLARWGELCKEDRLWEIPAIHTKKRKQRTVPISPTARAAITELRLMKRDGDERLFEVFPNPATISVAFGNLIRKAKIDDFKFHDLRHEAISRMFAICPASKLPSLMKIVGHENFESLMRYSHLNDSDVIGLFG